MIDGHENPHNYAKQKEREDLALASAVRIRGICETAAALRHLSEHEQGVRHLAMSTQSLTGLGRALLLGTADVIPSVAAGLRAAQAKKMTSVITIPAAEPEAQIHTLAVEAATGLDNVEPDPQRVPPSRLGAVASAA